MTTGPAYVVDASVAVKWFFAEEDNAQAMALLRGAAEGHYVLLAPDFLVIEVANAVWKRHRRAEVTVEEAAEIIERIAFAQLDWTEAIELVPRAATLAMTLNCTVYDALYLALAEAYDAVLVTADHRLGEDLPEDWRAERIRMLRDVPF